MLRYEVQQIDDTLTKSAMLYVNIPIELVAATSLPIARIADAAKRKDDASFQSGYTELKTACNACHTAAGVSFIRIQTPTSFPSATRSSARTRHRRIHALLQDE